MQRALRWYDTITINIYFLGLTTISQTNTLVIPLLVQSFVGEEVKGTLLGWLRLGTLMVALLAQALMGMLSDYSRLRWGRRRPFILAGTLLNMACIIAIGIIAGLSGMSGYILLYLIVIIQQVSSNIAHGAQQGLIPDLVPENQRGRYSGIKAVLELPIPMILVAFTIATFIKAGNLWGGLLVAMGILFFSMLVTMLVPERRPEQARPALDWEPFLRLIAMTALFTVIIIFAGQAVQWVGRWIASVSSATLMLAVMGAGGLLAMVLAVGLGVWLSVRVSLGTEAAGRNPGFVWWVVNRLAYLVGAINLSTFAVYYIQARLGYERETAAGPASMLIMMVGVFILVTAIPSGWLADRFGRKNLVALAGIVAAAGTLLALSVPSLTFIYIGGAIIGAATGLFFTANWALGTELVPKEEAGRYLGISNLAGAGAGAVGAYIGGPIADYFTVNVPELPGIGYVLLFGIYGTLFLLSVVALRGVRAAPAAARTGAAAAVSMD